MASWRFGFGGKLTRRTDLPEAQAAMATEEWVKRAIENSKSYEELPQRVRTLLPITEWKAKYAIPHRSFRNTHTTKS